MGVLYNFIEITFRHECSFVNLLHIFRIPFPKNTIGGLLLNLENKSVINTLKQNFISVCFHVYKFLVLLCLYEVYMRFKWLVNT